MQRFFKSITFVEDNIYNDITVHDIAKASHYSTYHFSRIFKSLVGESPKEYLRKRRLTIAADRLLREDISLVDLAMECQFESQEAFTRAFKQLFNITPGQYRQTNEPYRLLYRDQFSPHMLHHLQQTLDMQPTICERPEIKVVGISETYTDDDLDLNTLWSAFKPFAPQITNRVGTDAFGIYESHIENENSFEFAYICCVEVEDFNHIPEGMVARTLPKQLYACFEHRAQIESLPHSLKYIWGSWLPKSQYDYVELPDFELYPKNYGQNVIENCMSIHIPIQPRKTK